MKKLISLIVPLHNEEQNIPLLHRALCEAWESLGAYDREILFVDDGSTDQSVRAVADVAAADPSVRCIEFSRNFGKEMATTAGLHEARGDAVIMLDADLQHPPRYIPEFVKKWEAGVEVVVGVRASNQGEGMVKKWGSLLFYRIMRSIAHTDFEQGETDFRLLDREVVEAYKRFAEHQRMTRSLINWLGFRRDKVAFDAPARAHGTASYSTIKLVHLALYSFISHSLFPLRFAGYLGIVISTVSAVVGAVVFVEHYPLHDSLGWHISGSAELAIINVFLVGTTLMCLGLIALYIESIHTEVTGRPLYVIRNRRNK